MALNILIIDDDAFVRDATALTLSDAGHQVKSAHNWDAAAAIIKDATPDLAITDLQLPGLDDAAIVALLRSRLPATPIVAVSGASPEVLARARAAGAAASVAKPFDWETLESAITAALRR